MRDSDDIKEALDRYHDEQRDERVPYAGNGPVAVPSNGGLCICPQEDVVVQQSPDEPALRVETTSHLVSDKFVLDIEEVR